MSGVFEGGVEIVACAIRPEGSLGHLAALLGFVLAAWWVTRGRGEGRVIPGRAGRDYQAERYPAVG